MLPFTNPYPKPIRASLVVEPGGQPLAGFRPQGRGEELIGKMKIERELVDVKSLVIKDHR